MSRATGLLADYQARVSAAQAAYPSLRRLLARSRVLTDQIRLEDNWKRQIILQRKVEAVHREYCCLLEEALKG